MTGTVVILGSAPDVLRCRAWHRAGIDAIVAINNAWQVRSDWDHLLYPKDFPADRLPPDPRPCQALRSYPDYVPAVNAYGGFVFCGGTMAFTAGYWALARLRPRLLAFLGCDMTYDTSGATHFYGLGTPDPLRSDPTLRNLEARSARLELIAADQGCAVVNLSEKPTSRLVFPRLSHTALPDWRPAPAAPPSTRVAEIRARETALGYDVPSGKYWKEAARFDPAALARLDALWLAAQSQSLVHAS